MEVLEHQSASKRLRKTKWEKHRKPSAQTASKTENHIILVDLRSKEITGKVLEKALGDVNITVNKNAVPDDPRSPFVTSGIRLGTPAVTTRGFREEEIKRVSNWICDVIEDHEDQSMMNKIKTDVVELTSKYPVYNL